MGNRSFVFHKILSAVNRVEFIGDRISYTVPRGRWCNVIVLNAHASIDDKSDELKQFLQGISAGFHLFSHVPYENSVRRF